MVPADKALKMWPAAEDPWWCEQTRWWRRMCRQLCLLVRLVDGTRGLRKCAQLMGQLKTAVLPWKGSLGALSRVSSGNGAWRPWR